MQWLSLRRGRWYLWEFIGCPMSWT